MKKTLLLAVAVIIGMISKAQSSTNVSLHIAQKMKDSLDLSTAQKDTLYSINNRLQSQKMLLRQQNLSQDSLMAKTQRIENTRDSLYRSVLTNEKYQQYKAKKRFLITNN